MEIVQVGAMHRITLKLARYSSPKQLFSQGKVHNNLNKLIIKSIFFKSTQSCIIFIVNLYFAKYETNTCRHEAKMFRNSFPHPKVNFDVFCIWPILEIV